MPIRFAILLPEKVKTCCTCSNCNIDNIIRGPLEGQWRGCAAHVPGMPIAFEFYGRVVGV
ncbi:MAG TPA: hypothetical protein VL992_10460 [Tepidisphaeraceae bacterium]|nr:hypothetical protein [Tepidisphaeraceae bacterium]